MNAQPAIQYIPLHQLAPSKLNARQTGGDNVDSLAASIIAEGLLQNLTVIPGKKGKFDVVAGNRRLRALQQLDKIGALASNDIPCRIIDADAAIDASAAENTIREQMHPADEVEAYARMHKAGRSVDDIAVRFGQSRLHVERMLKLAGVSPRILDTWREDEITLRQVQVLALTDDHEKQEDVWKRFGSEFDEDGDELREALTEDDISSKNRVASYIGLKTYEQAGGALRRDLFGDDVYLADRELAERLAMEKLEKAVERERKKGWLWVEPVLDLPYRQITKLERVYSSPLSAEEKAIAGVFLRPGHNGKVEIEGPYIRPADRKRAERGEDPASPAPEDAAPVVNDELTRPQLQRLLGWRTAILRATCARNPELTIRAFTADLAQAELKQRWNSNLLFHASIGKSYGAEDREIGEGINQAELAGVGVEDLGDGWRERLEPVQDDILGWLLQQPMSTCLELLATLVAPGIWSADSAPEIEATFMRRAGFDARVHWAPDGEWLQTLSKAAVLRIVREACGDDIANSLAGLKKKELAIKAAERLASTRYVPAPLDPGQPKTEEPA